MALTKVDVANIVTGVLPVANGGTGTSTGVAPGGSTTQVQYNNAGAFGGSSSFVFDGTNVGIGTSSPSGKLTVNTSSASLVEQLTLNNPDVNGAGSKISFRQGVNEFGTITSKFVSGAWQLDLGTNSFDPTITLKSGNVGIGTSSPSGKLDVKVGSYSRFYVGSGLYEGVVIGRRVADDSYATLQFVAGAATNPKIEASGEALDFYTNNTYRGGFDVSGNFKFNSGYGSAATAYGCRVWVSFTASSGAIRGSGNVSSVTRNGTGDYTVNFTNAMPDANYAFTTALKPASNQGSTNGKVANVRYDTTPTTTACRLWCYSTAGVEDFDIISLVVFR